MIVECITDNVNRTVSEVRNCFTKVGGNLGKKGTVTYMYEHVAYLQFSGLSEDEALEALLMAEVDLQDIMADDDIVTIIGAQSDLDEIKEALKSTGKELEFFKDEVLWLANNTIELDDEDLNSFKRFLALAEDTEDIQDVYHNVKLKEEDE